MTKLVALLLLISAFSVPGWTSSENETCTNLLHSIHRVSLGIDLTRFNPFPIHYENENGTCNPIFKFTCFNHNKWKRIEIPDHIVGKIKDGGEYSNTYFFQSLKDFAEFDYTSFNFNAEYKFGSFRKSQEYLERKESFLKSDQTMNLYIQSAKGGYFEINLENNEKMKLDPKFVASIEKLPTLYEDDPKEYDIFLQTYGTHYFQEAKITEYVIVYEVKINNDYFRTISEDYYSSVNENIYRIYTNDLHKSWVSPKDYHLIPTFGTSTPDLFLKNAIFDINLYDGHGFNISKPLDRKFTENSTKIKKMKVIKKYGPMIYGGLLEPISNLINNVDIRKQVDKSILIRLSKAALADIESTMSIGNFALAEKDFQKWLSYKEALNKSDISLSELISLEKKITEWMDRVNEAFAKCSNQDYRFLD